MAQEDQTPNCSSSNSACGGRGGSGGGGRSSKKQKPKKVPQRGLGVAQLEKIRLEEQQKKDASSSVVLNYIPSNQSTNSVPHSTDLLSKNLTLRLPQSVHSPSPNTVPLVPGFVSGSKAWNCLSYYHIDNESSSEVDPGLAIRRNSNLPYESSPIWPLPSMIPRAQQFLHPPSMVNASSRNSSSSSVLNFEIEPPSNQIYYGKYTTSPAMWLEEEKMVGMKRPNPFSMDNPPSPHSFPYNSPAFVHSISCKSDDLSNNGAFCFEPGNHGLRECPAPCFAASFSESDSKKCSRINGDFLSLATPANTSTCTPSIVMYPSPYLASQSHELLDFGSLPYQENVNDLMQQPRFGPGHSNQLQQPCYNFFSPATTESGPAIGTISGGSEVGESVDLNLKL